VHLNIKFKTFLTTNQLHKRIKLCPNGGHRPAHCPNIIDVSLNCSYLINSLVKIHRSLHDRRHKCRKSRKVEKWSWIHVPSLDNIPNLITSIEGQPCPSYQVWSTSINAFVSYLAGSRDSQTHRHTHGKQNICYASV